MRWPGGGTGLGCTVAGNASGRALAIRPSTSRWRSAEAASRSKCNSKSACSIAWTKPRWRSGSARFESRGSAPSTGMPTSAIASVTSRRCRSEPTRLRTTLPMRTIGSCALQPRTTAAADWDCPETSSTRSTGRPKRAARSAVVPQRPGEAEMPSNNPIAPSTINRSALLAASAASASSSGGGMAQLSRLKLFFRVAAAWKAQSM